VSIIESALFKKNKADLLGSPQRPQSKNITNSYKKNTHKNCSYFTQHDISNMSQLREFSQDESQNKGLISRNLPIPRLMNEYRTLRTRLLEKNNHHNFITMITSITPEYDSSLITANIAASIALDETKTALVINTNMQSYILDTTFEIEKKPGLIDLLSSDTLSVKEILYQTPVKRLRYIPIGHTENSAERFSDLRLKQKLERILTRYHDRYLFLNAPSISNSADTRILLELCDKVLLVVPYGMSSEEKIRQSVLSIGSQKLAGIILEQFK
jgi:Mrp family chromosome partitioning ATPase